MTGDDSISTTGGYSHNAGIIPRVLYQLFNAVEIEGVDFAVKCSFIELYNEELRDLLSEDDSKKITIESSSSHGSQNRNASGVTRGQESIFIQSAPHGLETLQKGLRKRQVAATNINDLSSRSHTIFTISIYMSMRRKTQFTNQSSELHLENVVNESCVVGKINLVDLAGSENIGKSGAENKRAREAGIINQSLLTLGRVINALVDKTPHIPYRESKLTRLLQDSLGGQTRTCIIATISPASINYDETLSTLEYASKAKNIKNKPQAGTLVSKTTLLKEWSDDYIKLRRDWEATRKKNGVYLTEDHYKDLVSENDERRLRMEEQQRKISAFESQLKSSRESLEASKKQLLETRQQLSTAAQDLSEIQTNLATREEELQSTKSTLLKGSKIHNISTDVEIGLSQIADELISNLERQLGDINTLQDKIEKSKSNDKINSEHLHRHNDGILESYTKLEKNLEKFKTLNNSEIQNFKEGFDQVLTDHTDKLTDLSKTLQEATLEIMKMMEEVEGFENDSNSKFDHVKKELQTIQDSTQEQIRTGLGNLQKSTESLVEQTFQQVGEYKKNTAHQAELLKRDLSSVFQEINEFMNKQSVEMEELNKKLLATSRTSFMKSKEVIDNDISSLLMTEQEAAEKERESLLKKIGEMILVQEKAQSSRIKNILNGVQDELGKCNNDMFTASEEFSKSSMKLIGGQTSLKSSLSHRQKELETHLDNNSSLSETHGKNLESIANTIKSEIHEALNTQADTLCGKMTTFNTHFEQVKSLYSNTQGGLREHFTRLHDFAGLMAIDTVNGLNKSIEDLHSQRNNGLVEGLELGINAGLNKTITESKSIIHKSIQKIDKMKYVANEPGNTPPRRRSFDIPTRDISVKKMLEGYRLGTNSTKSENKFNFDFSLNLGDFDIETDQAKRGSPVSRCGSSSSVLRDIDTVGQETIDIIEPPEGTESISTVIEDTNETPNSERHTIVDSSRPVSPTKLPKPGFFHQQNSLLRNPLSELGSRQNLKQHPSGTSIGNGQLKRNNSLKLFERARASNTASTSSLIATVNGNAGSRKRSAASSIDGERRHKHFTKEVTK